MSSKNIARNLKKLKFRHNSYLLLLYSVQLSFCNDAMFGIKKLEHMNVAIGIINNSINREGASGNNRPLLKAIYTNYNNDCINSGQRLN